MLRATAGRIPFPYSGQSSRFDSLTPAKRLSGVKIKSLIYSEIRHCPLHGTCLFLFGKNGPRLFPALTPSPLTVDNVFEKPAAHCAPPAYPNRPNDLSSSTHLCQVLYVCLMFSHDCSRRFKYFLQRIGYRPLRKGFIYC